jgi:LuxR family maltose regulon positive regulatory protein
LEARTEGWVAGLQLAALSMRGRTDVAAFIAAFTGSNRYVLDYLAEEVLGRQPKEVQGFLLRTAILDRMTGALCDALTGRTDGQVILEILEQTNLFIIPLDQDRIWYRYHRLFAEFLRGQLRQLSPSSLDREAALIEHISGEMPDLNRRASAWFEGHDLLAEAIKHALQAPDLERAACLIERAAREVLMRGEASTLLSWLEALPQDVTRSRPRLCLAFAWALVMTSQNAAAEAYVGASLARGGEDEAEIHGEAATIRTFIAMLGGDVSGTIELARQALEYLPADDLFLRGLVALNLGLAYDTCEDAPAARQAYAEVRRIGQAADNALLSLMTITQLADLDVLEGKLHQAADTYREGIQIATEPGHKMPIAGMVYAGMGQLLYEWNDLAAADHYLTSGVELGRQWQVSDFLATCAVFLAQVKAARGDVEATQDLLRQADEAMQRPMISPSTIKSAKAFRARLWVWQGNLEAAARWLADPPTPSGDMPGNLRQIQGATRVRVLLAQGKPALALETLNVLLQAAEATGQTGNVIEALALRALALDAQGQSSAAMKALRRTLALAGPEGYVRTFVDEGEPMAELLRQARARGVAREYVSRLLAAFRGTTAERSLVPGSSSPLEPLSPRELEVLQLLAAGLSNKEIAQTLVIAVGTVKQHLKSIYGKLEVHNRTEAANCARELDLL